MRDLQATSNPEHEILENRQNSSSSGYASSFNERASASKSRETSRSPERYRGNSKQHQSNPQQLNSNAKVSNNIPRETYKTTLEHQPRGNGGGSISSGNKSSSSVVSDESHVEERLRALIAMLGKTKNETDNNNHEKEHVTHDGHTKNKNETLEPFIGGNLPNDEQGTLQYLSQLESVARRLKDQLLQDQQKVRFNKVILHPFKMKNLHLSKTIESYRISYAYKLQSTNSPGNVNNGSRTGEFERAAVKESEC